MSGIVCGSTSVRDVLAGDNIGEKDLERRRAGVLQGVFHMSDRIHRFVEAMNVQPGDRILEIGCGHGVAASLIGQKLTTGCYVGIDRSDKMVGAATKRNAQFVSAERARFVLASLESYDPGTQRFDKVIAMRVRLFHDQPLEARRLAERWLAPKGKLFVEYDEPGGKNQQS